VGKLITGIIIFGVIFFVAINTQMTSDKAMAWVETHAEHPNAPKVMFWAGWWCDMMGDDDNAIKFFWNLYKRYPEQNAYVAEGLYRIADIKAQGSSRLSCLEYCQIVMDSYPSEEKWRNLASKLSEQVKNNVR
jgi:TolA-binding protein